MEKTSKRTNKRPRRKAEDFDESQNNNFTAEKTLLTNKKESNTHNSTVPPYQNSTPRDYDIQDIEPQKIDIDQEFENTDPLPATNRRNIRIRVLQAIYAQVTSEYEPAITFNYLLRAIHEELRKKFLNDPLKDDDSMFLSSLYFDVIKNKLEYEKLVEQKIENWELKRISQIDLILLLMGIHEFLHFKEIPVKVTINEYVEIAKDYGTEKSNFFINGLLDAIQISMTENQMIQKQGKGLIKN